MNIGAYGQGLSRIGLAGLSEQGQREDGRVRLNAAMQRQEQEAQGRAAGALTGMAARAAEGIYDQRKTGFDQKNAGAQKAFDQGDAGYRATHERPEYSALDDIAQAFEGWF